MTDQLKRPPELPFAPRRHHPQPSDYFPTEVAVLLSVLLHVSAFMTWQYRGTLSKFTLFKPLAALLQSPPRPVTPPKVEPTITFIEQPTPEKPKYKDDRRFIETDATQPTGAEPKDAPFYSDRSTVSANPNNPTDKTGETPYLEGKDTRMMSTESVIPKPGAAPAPPPRPAVQPAPAPKPVTPQPKEEPPKKLADEGHKVIEEKKVVMLEKPVEPVAPPRPPAPASEPAPPVSSPGSQREIASLKSKLTASGVSRIGVAAFNVAGSPFGDYDKALIRAVQSLWYALIEKNGLYERAGQVTLKFNLLADGSVQAMSVKENSAGEILGLFCEKAVVDSAPFAPLPDKLRDLIGDDAREVNFTFYY